MTISEQQYSAKGLDYTIRSARPGDGARLAALRALVDSESEYLDREPGEAVIDAAGFERRIAEDSAAEGHLLLVAEAGGELVGFARCEGSGLRRLRHQAEFGVGVAAACWGHGVGRGLLARCIHWADEAGLRKLTLKVLAENERAIALYQSLGFEQEGRLRQDKFLSDGRYHDTLVMGRLAP